MAKQKEKEIVVQPKSEEKLIWVDYEEAQKLIVEEKVLKEIKVFDGIKKYGFEKG